VTRDALPSESPSSRAARKDETQARIVHASMELFATRGYEATSISAIAAKAEISRGAVFWHFGSKEGLFKEACKRFFIPFWRRSSAASNRWGRASGSSRSSTCTSSS